MEGAQRAEHNVEKPLASPCRALNNNGFRLGGHFYIILPATLLAQTARDLGVNENTGRVPIFPVNM